MTQTQSQTEPTVVVEDDRTGMSPKTLERAVLDHLFYTCSKDLPHATMHDLYRAMAHAVRDRLVHRWIHTMRAYREQDVKRAYYLSAEFLLGRALHGCSAPLRHVAIRVDEKTLGDFYQDSYHDR